MVWLSTAELHEAGGVDLWPQYQQLIAQLRLQQPAATSAAAPAASSPLPASSSVASELKSAAWDHLHSGHWSDVALVWRTLYERAALADVILLCGDFVDSTVQVLDSTQVVAALRSLDLALMMGSQDSAVTATAHAIVAFLESLDRGCSNKVASVAPTPTESSLPRKRASADNDTLENASACRGSAKSKTTQTADAASTSNVAPAAATSASVHPSRLPCPPVLPSSPFARPLPRLTLPSLQSFQRACMSARTPTIICGAMDDWPAIRAPTAASTDAASSSTSPSADDHRWSNLRYLQRVCGRRTVPVELGAHYMRDEWSQQLMTVDEFLEKHILSSSSESKQDAASSSPASSEASDASAVSSSPLSPAPVGYLAQHRLFDQVPALRNDIRVPDYCLMQMPGDDSDDPVPPQLHAWFGPCGTISPLHFDPAHNLLAQVVGSKYVRLYAEELTGSLYPNAGALSNTSQIDVERMDAERFPKATNLPYWEGILQGENETPRVRPVLFVALAAHCVFCLFLVCSAGELLYIPPRCWHYIRSLSLSFSVSFWWG